MQRYPVRNEKTDRTDVLRSDGKLALGVAIGAFLAITVFLTVQFTGKPYENQTLLDILPIIVSLVVALLSAWLSTSALLEQRRMREAGTDPVLVVHLGQREDARELTTFNISNIGAGAGLNIKLDVEKPEDDMTQRKILTNIFRKHRPFSVLPQGKSIEFNFAMGWNLLGDNPLPPFQAKLRYEDLTGTVYESDFVVDVRELEGLGSHKSPQMRIVKALEGISKKL